MHLLAEKIIVSHLIKIGIIKETNMDELIEKRVGAVTLFFFFFYN